MKPKNERKPPIWKRDVALRKAKLHGLATKSNDLKLVGLKVGASQIAAARVHNNGVPELVQIARQDLEPGIVVGGELRDTDALAESLKTFFRKNKLPKRGVRLGIANNRIGVRTFDVVGIEDAKQLDNAVRFRAQEALPIPIDEAVLDYQILREFTDEEGQPVKRVLLVVAYRELVDRYVAACKKAGHPPDGHRPRGVRAAARPRGAAARGGPRGRGRRRRDRERALDLRGLGRLDLPVHARPRLGRRLARRRRRAGARPDPVAGGAVQAPALARARRERSGRPHAGEGATRRARPSARSSRHLRASSSPRSSSTRTSRNLWASARSS